MQLVESKYYYLSIFLSFLILIIISYDLYKYFTKPSISPDYALSSHDNYVDYVKFLDRSHNLSSWKKVQAVVDCLSYNGSWTNVGRQYRHLCFQEPWKTCSHATQLVGLQYEWVTNHHYCMNHHLVEPFTLHSMCHMMQGKTIMIIGDSINGQFATSILNQCTLDYPETCDPDTTIYAQGMHEIRCHHLGIPNFRLLIVRNDRLSLVNRVKMTPGVEKFADFVEYSWLNLMNITDPALVILNRGAHYENTSKLINDVDMALNYISIAHPNIRIIWRNTPRGIENSSLTFADHPMKIPTDPNRPSLLPYAYEHFHKQNTAVRQHISSHYPLVIYWDIAYAMSFREDGHRDPLHYCFPGPMDTWPWFLYNILKIMNHASELI